MKNSFLALDDDENTEIDNLQDEMSNNIDSYYENMNEFLEDRE